MRDVGLLRVYKVGITFRATFGQSVVYDGGSCHRWEDLQITYSGLNSRIAYFDTVIGCFSGEGNKN